MILWLSFSHLLHSQVIFATILLQKTASLFPRQISKTHKAVSRLSSTQDYVAAALSPTRRFILFPATSILNRWRHQ